MNQQNIKYEMHGIPVTFNANLMDSEARSWRERLFTFPWKPWQKTKLVPSNQVVYTNGVIIIHPNLLDSLIGNNIVEQVVTPMYWNRLYDTVISKDNRGVIRSDVV